MHNLVSTEQQIADDQIWKNIAILIGAIAVLMGMLAIGITLATT
jgi:hypothetical protein